MSNLFSKPLFNKLLFKFFPLLLYRNHTELWHENWGTYWEAEAEISLQSLFLFFWGKKFCPQPFVNESDSHTGDVCVCLFILRAAEIDEPLRDWLMLSCAPNAEVQLLVQKGLHLSLLWTGLFLVADPWRLLRRVELKPHHAGVSAETEPTGPTPTHHVCREDPGHNAQSQE